MSKKKKFIPMKVYFNRETFRLEQKRAKEKLEHLSEGLKWCEKHIDVSKMSRSEFLFDMEKAFSDEVIKQHGDIEESISSRQVVFPPRHKYNRVERDTETSR